MIIYAICLVRDINGDKKVTLVDCYKTEYDAAIITADMNKELSTNKDNNIIAISVKRDINKIFVDKLKTIDSEIPYTIFAEIDYDFINNKIVNSGYNGIKYVSTRPYQTLIDYKSGIMSCYIPYQDDMEENILKMCEKFYECTRNKNKINKGFKRK